MNFKNDRRKQLLAVLISASALIPIYVIYMAIFQAPIQVSIFTSIYSSFILVVWVLYYFDFFNKNRSLPQTNGQMSKNNEETIS